MGVTLTGILWIKDSQTKWVEMLEECSSEGQVHQRESKSDNFYQMSTRQSRLITELCVSEHIERLDLETHIVNLGHSYSGTGS